VPRDLIERRTLLFAQASARNGDRADALAALATAGTDAALLESATLREQAHDWGGAAHALADYAQRTLPPQGPLGDKQQRLILRWASAASQAGDAAALSDLRQREGARMQGGKLDGMFRLLTADPVRNIADLNRAGQETQLARALPDQLKAIGGAAVGH
jgi:hypothetical protein